MTIATGYIMIDVGIIIYMLILIGNYAAITPTFGAFALQNKVETVACYAIMERYYIVVNATICLLLNINIAYSKVLRMSLFKAI